MKTEKTLVFFIDALRKNQIQHMPFVNSLMKKHQYLDMMPSVGYSEGAHSSIFSGLHQDKHGKFLIYSKKENSDYFSFSAKFVKLIPQFFRPYTFLALKLPYYQLKLHKYDWKILEKYRRWFTDYPPGMPPAIAKNITMQRIEPKHKETLLTVLDKNKISWMSQTDTNNYYLTKTPLKDCSKFHLTDAEIDFFYFYYVDGWGHYKGPQSSQMKDYLKKMDGVIKKVYTEAEKKHKKVNFFLFSDHGMVEIDDFVNVKEHFDKANLKHGKDYMAFYDATMVRVWILDKKKEKQILEVMKKVPKTTFMTKKLIDKYHLNFKDNRWFDYMLVMNPGVRPFPDYFIAFKKGIKAYHGYIPEMSDKAKGVFMTNAFKTKKQSIELVEIMPTMLKSLGHKDLIPKNIDGKSII